MDASFVFSFFFYSPNIKMILYEIIAMTKVNKMDNIYSCTFLFDPAS